MNLFTKQKEIQRLREQASGQTNFLDVFSWSFCTNLWKEGDEISPHNFS